MKPNHLTQWPIEREFTVRMDNGSEQTLWAVDEDDAKDKAERDAAASGYCGLSATQVEEI